MNENSKTFKLIKSLPSFEKGMNRILDFYGDLDKDIYNTSPTQEEADYIALKSDWEATGDDIRKALNHITLNCINGNRRTKRG